MTDLGIEAFLTIYREGSITGAAQTLYINQSSLSTRLRNLEKELGQELFYRSKGNRKLSLTPAGERFLPLAQQHQALENQMYAVCNPPLTEEILRISSLNSIGSYMLPPVYEHFSNHFPEIRLEIKDIATAEARKALERDKLDVAFSGRMVDNDQIVTIPFMNEPMAFLCSARSDYPDPVNLEDLSVDHQVYSVWTSELRKWHQSVFGTEAKPQIRLGLMSQIRLFISRPQAWAVVPRSIADALQNAPDLRRCKMSFAIPDRRIYLLCRRAALTTRPTECFLASLKTVMETNKVEGLLL
ncbi:MAG: LysR family transcriptional regulator [Clostridia bacterium]|nr:LysR family transcriptional regulator [Clostridia bacterium]